MTGPKYPNQQTEDLWFNTIVNALIAQDMRRSSQEINDWWLGAACDCISRGHAQLITSRDGKALYMLRCWLSLPKQCTAGQHAKYESGDANLLHWILMPDDIPHLHNHPWEFETRILQGGYKEERNLAGVTHQQVYVPGSVVRAGFDDFHRIAAHLQGNGNPKTGTGGTWSLVTTGARGQPWQFRIADESGVRYGDAESYLKEQQ